MATLSREKVIDQWSALVERGAGKDKWVIDKTEALIKQFNAPGVSWKREAVSAGVFSNKRDFLIVTHQRLKEYAMFISARDFGRDLDVSWYLTVNPGSFKRAISKRLAYGDPNALSTNLDVFAKQDLSAYTSAVHHCLQDVLKTLMESELNQDYATIDRKSKGFLSVW
jgi:hypothetical protein